MALLLGIFRLIWVPFIFLLLTVIYPSEDVEQIDVG